MGVYAEVFRLSTFHIPNKTKIEFTATNTIHFLHSKSQLPYTYGIKKGGQMPTQTVQFLFIFLFRITSCAQSSQQWAVSFTQIEPSEQRSLKTIG